MKKINQLFLIITVTVIISTPIFSQVNIDTTLIASFDSTEYYFKFKKNNLSVNDLITSHPQNFRMGNSSSLQLINESQNLLGGKVYRYNQTYNNIPIEDSRINIEVDSDLNPTTANGKIFPVQNLNITPSISVITAIQKALNVINATKYYWEDSTLEAELKEKQNDINATYYPVAQLVIFPRINQSTNAIELILCYKVLIYAIEPVETSNLFIDANSGELIEKRIISMACADVSNRGQNKLHSVFEETGCTPDDCQQGTAPLHAYGSQYIYTDKFSYGVFNTCKYRLKDNCTGTTLYTRKYILNNIIDHRHDDNNWSDASNEDINGATAHWSIERTHDYFRNRYGRNSWDGNYSQLSIYTDHEYLSFSPSTNAWWTGNSIIVTKAYGSDAHPFIFLDWIGHEFTHGITATTGSLAYNAEPGALNEGFSDIFGTMVEYYGLTNYSTTTSPNYTIGEHTNDSGLRNMANPNQFNHPDTYGGDYWANIASSYDNGGVHTNSGVLNYWFYLLAEGGSGQNDLGNQYCVQGIGKNKATDIAWKTLTTKLYSSAIYSNCRFLSIQSAEELYGIGSNEAAQVTAAWYAVGVGSNYNGNILVQNHTATGVENYNYNNRVNVVNFTANSGSNVTITSNTEIAILPNFSANQGSLFSAYITPACAGGARLGNPNNEPRIYSSSSTISNEENNFNRVDSNPTAYELNVFPNPNNGEFKLTLNNNIELPKSIVIRDILGREIKTISNPTSYEHVFDLKNMNEGLYIVNVFYSDRTMSKRIVKN